MGGGAGIVGPLLGFAGDIAGAAMTKRAAKRQMDFQREMASTQHQRAAKDLEAAGLNRILALGRPNAAPAGAAPKYDSLTKSSTAAVSSARQINEQKRMGKSQRDLHDQQEITLGAQAESASAQAAAHRQSALESADRMLTNAKERAKIDQVTGRTAEERRQAKVMADSLEELGPGMVSVLKLAPLLAIGGTGAGAMMRMIKGGRAMAPKVMETLKGATRSKKPNMVRIHKPKKVRKNPGKDRR